MMVALARLVRMIAGLVVLVIVVGILLRVLGANPANSIVSDIHDAGRALVGPFKNMFTLKNPKSELAVNWGLAAVVYLIVGGLVAGLITRAAPRGLPPNRAATTSA
jgi:ABC-type dipeptide/oligopeptide/nickel transport system permease component